MVSTAYGGLTMPTHIEWAEEAWNPVVGCSRVSSGCANCYAIPIAHRLEGNPNKKVSAPYRGLTVVRENGSVDWTGTVRLLSERLHIPLSWKKPRRVFVNSMSDLFHESLPFEDIEQVFEVMTWRIPSEDAEPDWVMPHTFLILTKRPERMAEFIASYGYGDAPNIWWGVSCEDQQTWEIRVPILLGTPVKVRWVSAEPVLDYIVPYGVDKLDWVVVGGESGPRARPCRLNRIEWMVRDCRSVGTPVFVKQLGSHLARVMGLEDRKGGNIEEFPSHLRVRGYPS